MKTKLCSSALWFLDKALHIVLQQLSCTNPKVFVAVPILVFRIYDEPRCHSKGLQQTVVFFYSTVCLLILLQKCCTVSKKQKTMCFFGQYSVFVNFLAKVLYCPKKTNPFLQKCCTVPKKPKKQSFQVLGPRRATRLEKIGFFGFLGQYSTFAKKDWFFWDSTVFLLIFLQKCCTVPKKPIFFCKSAVLSQKTKKTNLFQSCCPARSQDLKRLFFLVFLGQYSTLAKKIGFFGTVQCFC